MKKIIFACILSMVCMFVGIATAENEGIFDPTTGQLHIPKVLVGSDYYTVDMQYTDGLNFTLTNAVPNSPAEEPPMSGDTIIEYHGGEILTYNFTYNSHYNDGSGLVDLSGIETSYIYSGYTFSDLPHNCIKIITEMDSGTSSLSTNNYYFYDDNGNFIQFLTSNDNFFTNQSNTASGSKIMPNILMAGYSWTNDPLAIVVDGDVYDGKRTFTIIKKETIRIPFGNVEAYKINFSGSFEEAGYGSRNLTLSGTLWIHPKIGIVKIVENMRVTYYVSRYISYANELVSINWPLE